MNPSHDGDGRPYPDPPNGGDARRQFHFGTGAPTFSVSMANKELEEQCVCKWCKQRIICTILVHFERFLVSMGNKGLRTACGGRESDS